MFGRRYICRFLARLHIAFPRLAAAIVANLGAACQPFKAALFCDFRFPATAAQSFHCPKALLLLVRRRRERTEAVAKLQEKLDRANETLDSRNDEIAQLQQDKLQLDKQASELTHKVGSLEGRN